MSSTVLSGDFTVYYLSETRQKRIVWSGTTGTYSVRELYAALQDLFDESAQMDDGVPMASLTPTEYQIGLIDLDDTQDPWYIDGITTQHLSGGGLVSKNFTRIQDSRTGIVRVRRTGTDIVSGDVGNTIVHNINGDSGTLLFVAQDYLVVRPADNTSANNWTSSDLTTDNITCNGHSDTQIEPAVTGGTTWANIYTIGTIAAATSIYVIQDNTKVTAWWSTGHIDVLLQISRQGILIDSGYITIYAREYGKLYDHYQSALTTGGRSPVPLATSADLNNATAEGTIAALTGITFTFGADTKDLSNGSGLRPYDVVINCGGNTIKNFYEYTKYVTRRTSTTSLNGMDGEQYTGVGTLRLSYDGRTAAFTEGLIVSTATGTAVITADHYNGDNTGILTLHTVRGTLSNDQAITDSSTGAAVVNGTPETITEVKVAPFGTFAGGKFYGATGVYVYNMHGDDSNNYQLTDTLGEIQSPPATVPISVGGVQSGDSVGVFRALDQNGTIDKTYIVSHASSNSSASTTWTAASAVPLDTPLSGFIRLRKTATQVEERIAFTARTTTAFTLSSAHSGGYTTGDTAYVPYIDDTAGGTSISTSVTYDAVRNITTRVRKSGIQPYTINTIQLTSAGYSATATRIEDLIA